MEIISKALSLIVAMAYVALAYAFGDGAVAMKMGMFLILPLACIWFSESMGGYVGGTMRGQYIGSTTPGCLVAAGGWLLLLIPLVIGLVTTWTEK
jgi:uncharacterized membrane protein YoaT (DUF817 family)